MKFAKRAAAVLLAAAVLASAGCQHAPTWQEQYDLGVRYLTDGAYEEAIIAFTAAIELDPDRPEAYLERGKAYKVLGGDSLQLALEDFASAFSLDGTLEEAYSEHAETALLAGGEDAAAAAQADYRKLVELDSSNEDAWLALLDSLVSQNDMEEAGRVLEEARDAVGEDSRALQEMEEQIAPEQEEEAPQQETPPADLVVDAYAAPFPETAEDYAYHSDEVSRIPKVNLPGEDVAAKNEEIYSLFYQDLASFTASPGPYDYYHVDYVSYVNGDTLSLITESDSYYDGTPDVGCSTACSFSIGEGRVLTAEETVARSGLTMEEYQEQAGKVLGSYLKSLADISQSGSDAIRLFNQQLAETLSDESIRSAEPYFNEKGNLCISILITNPYGPGYYEQFDLSDPGFPLLDSYAEPVPLT